MRNPHIICWYFGLNQKHNDQLVSMGIIEIIPAKLVYPAASSAKAVCLCYGVKKTIDVDLDLQIQFSTLPTSRIHLASPDSRNSSGMITSTFPRTIPTNTSINGYMQNYANFASLDTTDQWPKNCQVVIFNEYESRRNL